MADREPTASDDGPRPQAELVEIRSKGFEAADVIALAGYVGAPPSDGVVRLHPGLDDMSTSIDIAASDILATRDGPTTSMPLGGVIVWLSRTADVTYRRTRTVLATAQQVRRFFGAGPAMGPETAGDRLNIQLQPMARRGVPPIYIPPEVCNPCQSTNCRSQCLPPCQSQ